MEIWLLLQEAAWEPAARLSQAQSRWEARQRMLGTVGVVTGHETERVSHHLGPQFLLDGPVHKCLQEEKPPALKDFQPMDSASPWLSSGP